MEKSDGLEKNHVVQLSPDTKNPAFACCFMVVDELKSWGAQGYVHALGTRDGPGSLAYYRANWAEMEYVGPAKWVLNEDIT